jgi:N-acetyl-gamma-glutamylphosphate reductase
MTQTNSSSNGQRGRVVAIAGATGAVGEVLLRLLEQRNFPVAELRPLASERSAGATVTFRGQKLRVEVARPEAFDRVDLVFFAATGALAKELAPQVATRGGIAIDKSNTWRMDPKVPLVVPEINGDALERHEGIIASPNCTTAGGDGARATAAAAKLKRGGDHVPSASGAGRPASRARGPNQGDRSGAAGAAAQTVCPSDRQQRDPGVRNLH